VMASKADKGKEVEIANKGLKWLRKETKELSSSTAKGTSTRIFEAKVVEPHGLTWFNTQKVAKYAPENWIDKGLFALEFPIIPDKVRELGLGYIFVEPEEFNLTLVREFYENWGTSLGESNEIKIWVQLVHFTFKRLNSFLSKHVLNLSEYFIFLKKPHTTTFSILYVVSTHPLIGQGTKRALPP
ncbi:hypothetical protein HAX54_036169, partial [Datura stramonium]|nr:hypothetical protein [Datura stramonium]